MLAMQTLRVCLDANLPCVLWGPDGEGKTSAVLSEAKARGWHCFFLVGSNLDPTDIGGIPAVIDGEVSRLPVALAIREAKRLGDKGEHVIIFLDEGNTSAPAVQATQLTLTQEGLAGDVQLSKEFVHYVMAANPPEIAVNASDFQPPTCTRFVHIDWKLDFDVWKSGMLSGDWAPVKSSNTVVAFLERRRSAFRQDPTVEFVNKPRATPRTWTNLAKLLEAAGDAPRDIIHNLAEGVVGQGVASEFMGFWDMREHVLPPEVILGQASTVSFPERADLCYLMFSSVSGYVAENPTVDNWKNAWTLIGRTENTAHFDKAALCAQGLASLLSRPEGKQLRRHVPKEAAIFANMFRELGALKGGA